MNYFMQNMSEHQSENVITFYKNVTRLNVARNGTSDENIDAYLIQEMGPKCREIFIMVLLTTVYGLIFVSGIVGNICTCTVIARNHYMQTTTNCYIFSLSISDVIILVLGLPPEAYSIWEAYPWRFGESFCILRALLMEATSYASVMTITAFTVERYIAIRHPLKAHKIAKFSRCIRTIIAIWIIAFLCALPYAINTELFFYLHDNKGLPITDSLICNIPIKLEDRMGFVFQLSTYVFFVLPMTVIIVLYILIGLALRKAEEERIASDESNHRHDGSSSHAQRKVVLKLLVAVVVAFFICWAPYHAQRLLTVYNKQWTPALFDFQSSLFYVSGVLYFIGSTVNPILYNVMSKRYQQAFKETILRCKGSRRRSNSKQGSYRLSLKGDSAFDGHNSSCRKNPSPEKNYPCGTVVKNGAARQVKKVYFSRNVSGAQKQSYKLGSNAKIAHPKLCRIVHKNARHIQGVRTELIKSDVTGTTLITDGRSCIKSDNFV